MVTSPAPSASRASRPPRSTPSALRHTDQTEHSEPRSATSGRSGIVVRLELPVVDDDGRPQTDHSGPDLIRSSRPAHSHDRELDREPVPGPGLDPEQVARAVQELLRALAPTLAAQVRVDVIPATAIDPPAASGSTTGPTTVTPTVVPLISDSLDRRRDRDRPGGGLELDHRSRTLTVDGAPISLTRREFDLLAYLQQRRGEAFSRPELMAAVWRTGYLTGDRTVDVHIRRIRSKLGRHADRLSTLRGFGYRLD